jgi:hypothetical protein
MDVGIAGSPDAFQAEEEGSIPFTRSNFFKGLEKRWRVSQASG